MFDLCFVLYNSEKWLKACVESFTKVNYDKKKLALYFADNQSTDNTLAVLEQLKNQYGNEFAHFEILPQKENGGFGKGSNAAARQGTGDYVFFCNVDTEIHPDAFTNLEQAIAESSEEFAVFEPRQFPYEHPKYYFPVTMEVSWCSGACFILRRDVFEKTGGFDESIFMYAEDVELSWRIRLYGYKIKYVPSAIIYHYSYQTPGEIKPQQVAGSITANLVIRAKYGTQQDIDQWYQLVEEMRPHWSTVPQVPELMDKQLERIQKNMPKYREFYKQEVKNSDFVPTFMGFDYEFAREGAFYKNHLPKNGPKISIIVRTYRRPKVLAMTLESLRYQTYKNFEVIVVEDGDVPMAQQVAENAKQWLDLRYIPAGKSVGQCEAGNIGLRAATGDYLGFLDDDDYFFAEHLEVLASLAEENPDAGMLVAGAIEAKTIYNNEDHTDFTYVYKRNFTQKSIEVYEFCTDNLFPIQAPIFKRELFEKYGGLDLRLDGLHDWDLWVRYFSHTKIVNTQKVTSIYKIPADLKQKEKRDAFINHHRKIVYENFKNYKFEINAQDLHRVVWTPESAEKQMKQQQEEKEQKKKLEAYKEKLQDSAREICACGSWRFARVPRMFLYAIGTVLYYIQLLINTCLGFILKCVNRVLTFVSFLIGKLLALFGKIFYNAYIGWSKLSNKIVPKEIDIDNASPEELHHFVATWKKSLALKLGERFSKKAK